MYVLRLIPTSEAVLLFCELSISFTVKIMSACSISQANYGYGIPEGNVYTKGRRNMSEIVWVGDYTKYSKDADLS